VEELVTGDVLVRKEDEVATVEHFGGEALHESISLEVEVAQHFVGTPSADEADDVGVDVSTEEGHGARGSERPSGDVIGKKSQSGWTKETDSRAKCEADIRRGDNVECVVVVVGR
jgi:hypothetical protein